MKPPLLCCLVSSAFTLCTRADYRDDTGYRKLQAELGAAMPDGTGVSVTQVESKLPSPAFPENSYLPDTPDGNNPFAGDGAFTGKLFTAKSVMGDRSFHAAEVGTFIYGIDTSGGTNPTSMCPGLVGVDCWEATSYTTDFLAPSGLAPIAETRAAQCHAWVSDATAGQATTYRDLVRRMDHSINRDNYVCAVGLNNGPTTPIPDLWASGYNVISVGVSNGEHSRGTVTSDMDGPGRRKPEMVVPVIATSYAAGYVTSAAALLRQRADLFGTPSATNARANRTIKAILLAGATKDEFPAWSKSATDPIDAIYGTGELNIYNSYKIMDGGEQPAGQATGRPFMAWDYNSLSNGSTEYRLFVPAGQYGAELSACVVWHRTPTDNAGTPGFNLQNDALANFDLTLLRYPSAGGAAVTIDSSTSTLYNIEHVWKKNLPAGNYSLRVSRTAGVSQNYAIAWRLTAPVHAPQTLITVSGSNFVFDFTGMLAGQPYKFQSSMDLGTWTDIESFIATGTSATRTLAKPVVSRFFYRLLPVLL